MTDSSPSVTVILASADSFLSDVKLFQSLRMWCEAPGFVTQGSGRRIRHERNFCEVVGQSEGILVVHIADSRNRRVGFPFLSLCIRAVSSAILFSLPCFFGAVRTRFFSAHIVYQIQAVLGLCLKDRRRGFWRALIGGVGRKIGASRVE